MPTLWDAGAGAEFSPARLTTTSNERQKREGPDEKRNEKKPWENSSNCLD